jgi:hypothetical protein
VRALDRSDRGAGNGIQVAGGYLGHTARLPRPAVRAAYAWYGAVCAMNAAYAATSTIVNTVNMDLCRDTAAGTDFTVLTCLMFLAGLMAGAVALGVAGHVGYRPVLLASAALLVVSIGVTARLFVDRSTHPAAVPAGVS